MFAQPIPEISVEELAQKLTSPERDTLQLIDVREPEEVAIARIEGFSILSLSRFAEWSGNILQTFDPEQETLVLCHHGMRSAQMCQWLASQGFTNLKNIIGGIDAYARRVDKSISLY
ncbi:MAG: rhodanese-related sulfurtransferase [Coleofasciculaceae cyanobacterium SM2_3_26]|nr:rhodanese-related sulfurtransferase [Coleofasciculaceae cyanobacterium SM2_3_26]